MIEGVKITPLRQIVDTRGKVMHMLRNDDPVFETFGEIYFSAIQYGAVKAWTRHLRMTRNYAVPHGRIKLVLRDVRENITEIFLGEDNYFLVTIPPFVWSGFKGLSEGSAIVANCATLPFDPLEIERKEPDDGYDWNR